MRPSEEATREGLRLAREAGEAYQRMVSYDIPDGGNYTVRVNIAKPIFSRHDKVNGRRYTQPVVAEFRDLEVKTKREAR